jgi:hypothetical protein
MYTDAELMALWALYDTPDHGIIEFCRALLAGEKAPPPIADELRAMMALNDAWTSNDRGHGVTRSDYWRGVISWKGMNNRRFASYSVNNGNPVVLAVPVELAKAWQKDPLSHYGIVLRGSGVNIICHSRQSAMGPTLVVNGVPVECVADASLSTQTAEALGGKLTLSLSNTSHIALRFGRIPLDIEIERAEIVLQAAKFYDGSGTIHAEEIIPPVEMSPPTIADIYGQEGNYFESESIGAGPTPYEQYLRRQLAQNIWIKSSWQEENGEKYLQIHWNNKFRSGSHAIPIFKGHTLGNSDPTEGRMVHLRYDVRLASNFPRAVIEGGKFPGFCSAGRRYSNGPSEWWPRDPGNKCGELYAGNGGGNVHGFDGWSARGGFHPRIEGQGHPALGMVPIHSYVYMLRQGNMLWHEAYKRYEIANGLAPGSGYTVEGGLTKYLQPGEYLGAGASRTGYSMKWDYGAPSGLLVPGRWHRVDQIIRVNDPGSANGWLHAYVDGRQVGKQEGIEWRTADPKWPSASTLGVACAWMNFYQGGTSGYTKMIEETHIHERRLAIKVLEWDE